MKIWPALALAVLAGCVNRSSLGIDVEFVAVPDVLPADGNSVSKVGVLVTSNGGESLPPTAQLFLHSSEPNALITQFTVEDANGWRWAEIRSRVAGTETLSLSVTNNQKEATLPQKTLITFNQPPPTDVGVPSAETSWLAADPNTVADDGQTATTLTLHMLDAYGTTLPGIAVTFTSTGSNNFFTNAVGITDVTGTLTATLASTTAEVKTVTARTAAMAVSTQVTFSAQASSSLFSSLTVNPNSLAADGTTTTTLTFAVLDTVGLPLPGAPVAWSVTGGNNILTPATTTTDANGSATATLASTRAEIKTVTATSGATQVSQHVTFLAGSADATTSTFVINPNNNVTADGASTAVLTFTCLDAFGNPVPGAAVSFSASGSNNTVSPLLGNTNASGAFTATMSSTKAETKTVTATSGSVVLTQPVTFSAGSPSATLSFFTANPTTLTADGVSTTTLTVTLEDAQGNPAPGQAVTFSSSGSNNTFAQGVGTTDGAGTYTTTLSSTTAEDKIVLASFAGGSASTDVTFVSGAPSSSMTTLTASPNTLVADGSSVTQLTVTVRDAFGNPVPLQAVSLSSTGSSNSFNPSSGSTDGTGSFSATLSSTTAEMKTITANAGGAIATATVTFVAGPPSGITTTLDANPTSVTADGSSHSTLTVTVVDINGNPVPNQNVTLTSTGSNYTIAAPSGSTNTSGVFVTTMTSTKAEAKTITATLGSVVEIATVNFVAGAPDPGATTLVANPNTVTANGSTATTLTVTVFDAHGNLVPNQSVSLSSSGANNFFGNASGTTNSAGVYSTTLASSTAEVKTVTAAAGSVNVTTPVTFTAGAPASTNCTLSANPTSVTADGVSTTVLTFVVKDGFGNSVPNQAVTLASTGGNNTFTPVGGNTDSTGTFVANLASIKAEVKSITGTAGAATASTTVTFVPGAVSSSTTTLVANPNTAAADGSSAMNLVTTALDVRGNPVPSQTVALSASGTNNTFGSPNGTTDSAGTFTTTLTSTTAQSETVTSLVAGTVTANANVAFTAPLVSPTNSTIVASPNSLTADGTTTAAITVTVLNGVGSPVIGAPVTMSASGINNTFSPVSGTTNGSGVFSTTLATTQAGVKTVTATVFGTALNTNVTFLPGTPSGTKTTLVANPNTVIADGTSKSTLTVTVLDINGNPEPNQTVSLSASGGNNIVTPASGTTGPTGVFVATIASTLAQTENVTATVNGTFNETATVIFVPGTVSGVTTTFVASPNTATADGTSAVTLTTTVKDAEGNPVPNQSVLLSSTGSSYIFTPISGSTNSVGVFTATMTSTKAEFKNVKATIGTVSENANVLFVAGPVSSTTSALVVSPTSVTANGNTTTITVTVEDLQGNPIANQNVTLSGNGTANTFAPTTGSTNPNGVFTATLSSTVAQTETITAAVGTVNLTAAMTFTPGAPSSGTSSLSASPTTLVANGSATTTLTVTVKDAQGNPVPSQSVSLGSSGTSNTITPLSGTTGPTGVFTATFASTTAQVKLITATVGGFTKTANVTFTAGPASSSTSTLTASPNALPDDGVSLSTLQVTVEDANTNVVSGQTVTFASSGGVSTPLSGPTCSTNALGVCSVTITSGVAQNANVTASFAGSTVSTSVAFVLGNPNGTSSSLAPSPTSLTADGVTTTTLLVTVEDATHNGISGQAVTFSSNGTSYTFSANTCTTVSGGQCSVTLKSTLAQTVTVQAQFAGVTESAAVTFVPGAPNAGQSSVTASPTSAPADGASVVTISGTVRDAQHNPVQGTVTVNTTGSSNVYTTNPTTSNASGVFSVAVTSTLGQTETFSVVVSGVTIGSATVTFTSAPTLSSFAVTGIPTTLVVNTSPVSVIVTALNNIGGTSTPYTGTVQFTCSDPLATLPTNYQFTVADAGVHTFVSAVAFGTVGTQSVSVADTVNTGVVGSETGIVVSLPVQKIAMGGTAYSSCALFASGKIKCWGNNASGGLGYGDTLNRGVAAGQMSTNLPFVNLGTGRTAVDVMTGGDPTNAEPDFTCAILDTGALTCWGDNQAGQLGLGDRITRHAPPATPINLGSGRTAKKMGLGYQQVCVVLDTNQVKCWGDNTYGDLGYGDVSARTSPPGTAVVNLGSGRTASALTGSYHMCALLDNNQIACWGDNVYGELGIGSTTDQYAPTSTVNLGSGRSAVTMASTIGLTCALMDNAQVKCWGDGMAGALGLGDTKQRNSPATAAINFGTGRSVLDISSACALLDNHAVECWSGNPHGELGLGDTIERHAPSVPVKFAAGRTPMQIAEQENSSCVIQDDASVKCWGYNAEGELGLGDPNNRAATSTTTPDTYGNTSF